jgi:hypothetical protein
MQRLPDHRRKGRTAPACDKGGSKLEGSNSKIERNNCSSPKSPAATPALDLITVHEACDRSGEKPATIINWAIRHKIGRQVKTGSGGCWMVYPDRLERLLAEREAAS